MSSASTRPSACRPTRSARPDRTGDCRRGEPDVMAANGFTWMRARARRYGDLYDGFRIDHLVGLYRMYVRPIDKAQTAFFDPADEPAQIALGETLVGILAGADTSARGDRRRSRIDPAVRARVDGASRSSGTQGAALGAALGSRRAAADRSRGIPRALGGDDGHARHRAAGGDAGRRDRGTASRGPAVAAWPPARA